MIGLIDCEALSMKEPFVPNLEIMKLYGYYKKSSLTKLVLSPDVLDAYTQIYLRRQFDTTPIPIEWTVNRRVNWGGFSFTNNIYIPMAKDIEVAMPNYHIYNEYIKTFLIKNRIMLDTAEKYFDYSFIRLHNQNDFRAKYINEGMPLLIYDKNLFQENDYEFKFNAIKMRQPKKIFFLFTPEIKSQEQLDVFIKYDLLEKEKGIRMRASPVNFNLDLTLFNLRPFLQEYEEYLKSFTSKKILIPTYSFKDVERFIPLVKRFETLVNLIYYMYTQGFRVGLTETWAPNLEAKIVMNVFASYVNNTNTEKKTFYNYFFSKSWPTNTKVILKKFYEANPKLHYLFDVSLTYLLLGGTWYGQFRNRSTSKFY